jgi:hypothetical protein
LRQRLIDWMANGGSVAAFARQNPDRSERQYRRWAGEPGFQAAVRKQSAELTQATARRLRVIGEMSTDELKALLSNADPSIRLGAVRTALRALIDIGKFADLESRITELEERNADGES